MNRPRKNQYLPIALTVMALIVTGCPYNDYTLQLKPQANGIERTLIFYNADGMNTNGTPDYRPFDTNELNAIAALYPAGSITNDGSRYVVRGAFNTMPRDIGGAGSYTNLATSLGSVGFYVERFRGNDDAAGMMEPSFKSADQFANLIVGWSREVLGREPGYDHLNHFLEVDFRRDLKNLLVYYAGAQFVNNYTTNGIEEFIVRYGHYLLEHGYFTPGEIHGLFRDIVGGDTQAPSRWAQRLVARKMGVPDTVPVPISLGFLTNEHVMEKSFTNYLASTDVYRARIKQWERDKKIQPNIAPPEPWVVISEIVETLPQFELFDKPMTDHLNVRLSLASSPLHSNGRWDPELKQVTWKTELAAKTNLTCLPFTCYANWTQADEGFQKEHLGQVALTGDELIQYCIWRTSLAIERGREWDIFLAGLKPGPTLKEKLDRFRFTGETEVEGADGQQATPVSSSYPRKLLNTALK